MVSDIRFRGAAEPTQAKSDNTGEIQWTVKRLIKRFGARAVWVKNQCEGIYRIGKVKTQRASAC